LVVLENSNDCTSFDGGEGITLRISTIVEGNSLSNSPLTSFDGGSSQSIDTVRHGRTLSLSSSGRILASSVGNERVPPMPPVNATLSVVSDTELGITFYPSSTIQLNSVTKYLIEWDVAVTFDNTMNPAYSAVIDTTYCSNEPTICTWNDNGVYRYKITGLTTSDEYWVRVSTYDEDEGYSLPITTIPQSAIPTQQLPSRPAGVAVSVNGQLIEDRLDVTIVDPIKNDLFFYNRDGGSSLTSDIRFWRIEYDGASTFDSGIGGVPEGTYDATNYVNDGSAPSGSTIMDCPVGVGCIVHLGAEIQKITLTTTEGAFDAGE
jgi:hypothetical protein